MEMKTKKKRIIKTVCVLLALLASLLGYCMIVVFTGKGIDCPVHRFTGLECPGCGNTRALTALLHLDIKAAFGYNPMIFAELLYMLWVTVNTSVIYISTGRYKLGVKPEWMNILFLIAFVGWGILRNIV